MPEIVHATASMIESLHRAPMPRTARVLAALDDDGNVLGVAGYYPQQGKLVMFAGISDEARAEIRSHRRILIRCARQIMGMAKEHRMEILAYADPEIEGSETLLSHLGFYAIGQGVWEWPGQLLQ
jgi:hypothetical protein